LSQVLEEHRHYLADRTRIEKYAAAIARVVKPGDVVIDLGAGTGILGLLALRAGAGRVYAIDASPALELARAIAAANGVSDRIVFIRDRSTRARLPERADVVVGDQLGAFGYGAGVLEYFSDARARLLKPGGVTVPAVLTFIVAPVASAACRSRVSWWHREIAGISVTPVGEIAAGSSHAVGLAASDLVAPPTPGGSIRCDENPAVLRIAAPTIAERDATIDGIGAWFEAELGGGVTMTNGPLDSLRIDREQLYYPLPRPLATAAGDRVDISIVIRPAEAIARWSVTITDPAGSVRASAAHSSFAGMLVASADLTRAHPSSHPVLSDWGRARQLVLELCDGTRSLQAIEAAVATRYAALFTDPAAVSRFVAEALDAAV
jgi:type I protein arginine methyltransferase